MKNAIIGGTGYERPFKNSKEVNIKTPFGEVQILKPVDKNFYFLSRHGVNHSIAPHKINYRANIWALKHLGVEYIYSLCAVGSIKKEHSPGKILLARDFLDFTKSRVQTFYDGENYELRHLEMSQPYSPSLNTLFEKYFPKKISYGTYVATEGPRFETEAEINFYNLIGGDIVGMTGVPEVILARELEMEYSCICTVTNYCTGLVKYVSEQEIATNKTSDKNLLISTLIKIFEKEENILKRSYTNFC